MQEKLKKAFFVGVGLAVFAMKVIFAGINRVAKEAEKATKPPEKSFVGKNPRP
ncbi:MAG: hypothetical protein PHQ47_01285 [Candidatus Portnoybacteria bacterium]|nr:hypothetical protein [Candidatus Portnoybacteria bacterium]